MQMGPTKVGPRSAIGLSKILRASIIYSSNMLAKAMKMLVKTEC